MKPPGFVDAGRSSRGRRPATQADPANGRTLCVLRSSATSALNSSPRFPRPQTSATPDPERRPDPRPRSPSRPPAWTAGACRSPGRPARQSRPACPADRGRRTSASTDTSNVVNRSGDPSSVPLTETRTPVTGASRARIAASRWLEKHPPSATSRYSPPRGPRSAPPFAAGRSTNTVCERTVAFEVEGPSCCRSA